MPTVSVIMNCYNGEQYLREAIDSVYAQTFQDWEIIFWDNASTDRTAEIAKSYDTRLRYFCSEKTVPLGEARKRAMEQVSGTWIAFLDCDDYWFPNKLEAQLKALEGTAHVLCYAGIREVSPDGSLIREILPKYPSGEMLEQQLNQFDINMVTPLLHRQTLAETGLGFDGNVTASEEYNLFVRLAAKGTFCTVPEILGAWRISPGSLTDRQISKWADERYYTLEQLKRENPGIETRYPEAFKEAYARGDYYRARYLVSERRMAEARAVMAGITHVAKYYYVLWIALYIPFAWRLIHSPFLKRKVLPKLLRIVREK